MMKKQNRAQCLALNAMLYPGEDAFNRTFRVGSMAHLTYHGTTHSVASGYPTPHHPPFTTPCMASAHLTFDCPTWHYASSSPCASHAPCIGNNLGLVDKEQHRYANLLSIQVWVVPWKDKPVAFSFGFVELLCVGYSGQISILSIFKCALVVLSNLRIFWEGRHICRLRIFLGGLAHVLAPMLDITGWQK